MLLDSTASTTTTTTTNPSRRGSFIVLEGVDRCGKTTQVQRLVARCVAAGVAAVAWRFPNRDTRVGQCIHDYLTLSNDDSNNNNNNSSPPLPDESIHLLFSANRWEAAPNLRHTLLQGTTIICDRYAASGVAFSAAKGNLSREWCKAPDVGLPAPDAVIYLDLDPQAAQQRGGYGAERYETTDFQTAVRQQFMELKKRDEINGHVPWHVVDAAQSMDAVEEEIWNICHDILQHAANRPVGKLWMNQDNNDDDKEEDEKKQDS